MSVFRCLPGDSDDLATSTAVREQLISGLRNPDIGRRLRRLVLEAGLTVTDLTAPALGPPNLAIAKAQFGLFDHLDAAGDVSAEAAAAWRVWLEASDARGRLFVASVAVRVVAEKPM